MLKRIFHGILWWHCGILSCLQLCLWWNYCLHLRTMQFSCSSLSHSLALFFLLFLFHLCSCFVGIFDVWTIVYWSFFIQNLYRFTIDTRWALYGVKSSIKEQSREQYRTEQWMWKVIVCMCVCARVLFARHILHSATIESIKLRQTSTMHKFYRYIDIQRSRKWFSFFSFNEVQVANILTSTRKFPQKWFWFEVRFRVLQREKKTHTDSKHKIKGK